MSSTTLPPAPRSPDAPPTVAPRSYMGQALRETFSKWGAKVGLAWLSVLAIFGLFGPLIASSYPLYVKTISGEVSSPWWRSLTAPDVALMMVGIALVIGLALRLRTSRLLVLICISGAIGTGIGLGKGSPSTAIYERWREMQRAGTVQSILRTPIPYSPNDRNRDNPDARQKPPTWSDSGSIIAPDGTKPSFLLGTDQEGSDVASRLIHASRTALAIGFIATGIATIIGVVVGGIMGYFAGWLDMIGMRLIEIFEAVPRLMLLLAVAAIFDANIYLMMVLIGVTGWMGNARFIRAEFLRLRNQDFVQAAQALGLPTRSIIFRHMLPNGLTPVLVSVSFGVAGAILIESTLAFLGIGKADQPSWGQLLNQARAGGDFRWWIAIFPGLMIFLTVFSYQLIGESMRDALDPKLRKRE